MTSFELCDALSSSLSGLFRCTPGFEGDVRVQTPLLYPDGGFVEVFVLERDGQRIVTDHGDAHGWLWMQSPSGKLTPNQRDLVADVCRTLDVELADGQLSLRCDDLATLAESILRLAQAVVRVSDIWFTFRVRSASIPTVADEVEQWLNERRFDFDKGVKRDGQSGRGWTVDYEISAKGCRSLVFVLSGRSRAAARHINEHVVAGCVDLRHLREPERSISLVSLFDDRFDVWRLDDFKLASTVSEVAQWSRRDEFERLLITG